LIYFLLFCFCYFTSVEMNIFILHKLAQLCAVYHCDKHVVKMILESTMMLYSACWMAWFEQMTHGEIETDIVKRAGKATVKLAEVAPKGVVPSWLMSAPKTLAGSSGYRISHISHPCTIWVRQCLENYLWLLDLAFELSHEYTYRYGKVHACLAHLEWLRDHVPPLPSNSGGEITEFAQAMPDEYKVVGDPVEAYRRYYRGDKARFAVWTKRDVPSWFAPPRKKLTFKSNVIDEEVPVKKGLTFKV